jgi:hypothetical protein
MLTLYKDLTAEQKALADDMLESLTDTCRELDKFATVGVYGLLEEEGEDGPVKKILFDMVYADNEGYGDTIFCSY